MPTPVVTGAVSAAATADKLELARRLASKINIAKNLGAEHKVASQMTAEAIMKGSGGMHPLITVSFEKLCNQQIS